MIWLNILNKSSLGIVKYIAKCKMIYRSYKINKSKITIKIKWMMKNQNLNI